MSGHAAIFGRTQSGKTHLAKALCRELAGKGKQVVVYDPFLTGWPGALGVTDEWETLLFWATHNECLRIFVDEIGSLEKSRWDDLRLLYYSGRHAGHLITVIGQRGEQVPPLVRESVDYLWLFRQGKEGAEFWARATGEMMLLRTATPDWPRYQFMHVAPFQPAKVAKLTA